MSRPELPAAGVRRVTVGFDRLPKWLDGFASRHGSLAVSPYADEVIVTGADDARAWIGVPFLPWSYDAPRPLTTLQVHLNQARRVGVLLVRRGGHAAGVFAGTELIASKVGTSYVQGTTKAGGWSQQRYARRRANQAAAAFADAADVAVRILLPEAGALEALICGGDKAAVEATLSDPRLVAVSALRSGKFLSVPDPRLRVLQATPAQFRTVDIQLYP